MRRAVFLDRDDTLIANRDVTAHLAHPGDLFDPALVQLLPGAADACRELHDAGFALVVVSNQGGVARGHGVLRDVERVNNRLRVVLFHEAGVSLDAIYYCPYHPQGTVHPFNVEHPWRKPAPGMFFAAASDLGLDLPSSAAIGDAPRDIEAAVAAGIPPQHALLVGPGGPYPDLLAAARWLLANDALSSAKCPMPPA